MSVLLRTGRFFNEYQLYWKGGEDMENIARIILISFGGTLLFNGLLSLYEDYVAPLGNWYMILMLGYALALGFLLELKAAWAGLLMTMAIGLILYVQNNGDTDSWLYGFMVSISVSGLACTGTAIIGSKIR